MCMLGVSVNPRQVLVYRFHFAFDNVAYLMDRPPLTVANGLVLVERNGYRKGLEMGRQQMKEWPRRKCGRRRSMAISCKCR